MEGKTIAQLLIKMGVKAEGANKAEKEIADLGKAGKEAGRKVDAGAKEGAAGVRKLSAVAKRAGTVVKGVGAGMKTALGAVGIVLGVVAAAGAAAFAVFDRVSGDVDNQRKLAEATGVTFRELQQLTFAATQSGASADDVSKSLRFLRKNLEITAKTGAGPMNDALDELGLSLTSLEGKPAEAQLGVIADALAKVESNADRTRLAAVLLGEETGPKLKTLLAEGSKGIGALTSSAKILSDEQAAQATAFQDRLGEVKNSLLDLAANVLEPMVPIALELITAFSGWLRETDGITDSGLGQVVDGVRKAFERVWPLMERGIDVTGKLVSIMAKLGIGVAVVGEESGAFGLAIDVLLLPLDALAWTLGQVERAIDAVADAFGSATSEAQTFEQAAASADSKSSNGKGRPKPTSAADKAQADLDAVKEQQRRVAGSNFAPTTTVGRISAEDAALSRLTAKSKTKDFTAGDAAEFVRLAGAGDGAKTKRAQAFADAALKKAKTDPKPAGGKGKAKAEPTSAVTLEDALAQLRAGSNDPAAMKRTIEQLSAKTPRAESIKPTTAITFYNITNDFKIDGSRDPMAVANMVVEQVKLQIGKAAAMSAKAIPASVVR
jgi:hypothetical protein